MSAQPPRPESRLATDEAGLRGPLESLRAILIPEESLDAWAVQRRLFALTHRRVLIAATSGRLVWITRRLLGGFDVSNVRWQDLEDVALHVGVFGADLIIRAGKPADLASEGASGRRAYGFRGLRKEQAQAVYRICQAQEQAWREKRRIRELEELRARAGGIQLGSAFGGAGLGAAPAAAGATALASAPPSPGSPAAVAASTAPDAARRLQEAKRLLDDRLITDSEYEAIKARILAGN
jgi:hypothetical protein